MNGKFFDVKKSKQDAIINAALKIFALNGYKNASTDVIVKEAGISKGLLFHYFESKKGLYEFIYDYSVKYMKLELTRAVSRTEKDFFVVQVQVARAKTKVLKNYPYMEQFINNSRLEKDPDALSAIVDVRDVMRETYNTIYSQTDNTRFLDKINIADVVDMISWMSDGFFRDRFRNPDFNLDEMNDEFERLLNMLRRHFYRNPGSDMESIARSEMSGRNDDVMEQFRLKTNFETRIKAGKNGIFEGEEEVKEVSEEKSIEKSTEKPTAVVIEENKDKAKKETKKDTKEESLNKVIEEKIEDIVESKITSDIEKVSAVNEEPVIKVIESPRMIEKPSAIEKPGAIEKPRTIENEADIENSASNIEKDSKDSNDSNELNDSSSINISIGLSTIGRKMNTDSFDDIPDVGNVESIKTKDTDNTNIDNVDNRVFAGATVIKDAELDFTEITFDVEENNDTAETVDSVDNMNGVLGTIPGLMNNTVVSMPEPIYVSNIPESSQESDSITKVIESESCFDSEALPETETYNNQEAYNNQETYNNQEAYTNQETYANQDQYYNQNPQYAYPGAYVDANGQYVNMNGQYVDANGQYIDMNGQYINNQYMENGQYYGQYMDPNAAYTDMNQQYMGGDDSYANRPGVYVDPSYYEQNQVYQGNPYSDNYGNNPNMDNTAPSFNIPSDILHSTLEDEEKKDDMKVPGTKEKKSWVPRLVRQIRL